MSGYVTPRHRIYFDYEACPNANECRKCVDACKKYGGNCIGFVAKEIRNQRGRTRRRACGYPPQGVRVVYGPMRRMREMRGSLPEECNHVSKGGKSRSAGGRSPGARRDHVCTLKDGTRSRAILMDS